MGSSIVRKRDAGKQVVTTNIVSQPLYQVLHISVGDFRVKYLFDFKLVMSFYFNGVRFGRTPVTNLVLMVWDEF